MAAASQRDWKQAAAQKRRFSRKVWLQPATAQAASGRLPCTAWSAPKIQLGTQNGSHCRELQVLVHMWRHHRSVQIRVPVPHGGVQSPFSCCAKQQQHSIPTAGVCHNDESCHQAPKSKAHKAPQGQPVGISSTPPSCMAGQPAEAVHLPSAQMD